MLKLIKAGDIIYSISSNDLIDVTEDILNIESITQTEFDDLGFLDSEIQGDLFNQLKSIGSFELLVNKAGADASSLILHTTTSKVIEEPELLIYSSSQHNPSNVRYNYKGTTLIETTKHDISTFNKTGIKEIKVKDNDATSSDASIRYAISFDDKSTWLSFISGKWETISKDEVAEKGMSKPVIESITEHQWKEVFRENVRLNFAISFNNNTTNSVSVVESLEVSFLENKAPEISLSLSSGKFEYKEVELKGVIAKNNQRVKYRVVVNGNAEPWSDYLTPYVIFERKYNFYDGMVNGINTLVVEAQDEFGERTSVSRQISLVEEDANIEIGKPIGSVKKGVPYAFPFKITPPFYGNKELRVQPKLSFIENNTSFNICSFVIDKDKATHNKIKDIRILNAPNRIYLLKVDGVIKTLSGEEFINLNEEVIDKDLFTSRGFINPSNMTKVINSIESNEIEVLMYSNIQTTSRDVSYTYVANNGHFRYRVFIDDPEMLGSENHILRNWTSLFTRTIDTSIIIPADIVKQLNPYSIFVEVEHLDGRTIQGLGSVHLFNEAPTIFGNVRGRTASIAIGDSTSDKVKFKIMLNGKKIYPESPSHEFTPLMPSPIDFNHTISFGDYRIGEMNNLEVIAVDEIGEQSRLIMSFFGRHTGLLFVDSNGEPFMSEDGKELGKLDFGVVYAGRMSEIKEAYLHNMCDYDVQNIRISVDQDTVDEYADVEISNTREPFTLNTELHWNEKIPMNEKKKFYIRVKTSHLATQGSVFKIRSKADPC